MLSIPMIVIKNCQLKIFLIFFIFDVSISLFRIISVHLSDIHHAVCQVDDVAFDNIPDVIGNYDICIIKNMQLNSDLISRAKRMKLIMQYGVGIEGIFS